jgi:ABC-type glycerol-3-phosphate transport system permease component
VSEERRIRILYTVGAAAMSAFCLLPVAYMVLVAASSRPDILSERRRSIFRSTS